MLRIGIIGTGGIADMHARGVLAERERLKLVAACDVDPALLQQFGDRYGIDARFVDYRVLLDQRFVDAVIVTLPHHLHTEACVAAFAAGKHVLLEKPIARTLTEADTIIDAAGRAGKTLLVGFNERYDSIHRQIYDIVAAGELGPLFCVYADHYQNFNPPAGSWWRSAGMVGGGCMIGSGIHRLDLLRWYAGEVATVSASQTYDPRRLEAEVAGAATLTFQNGAIGSFLCNWGIYHYPYCESMTLSGQSGTIYSDDSRKGHYLRSNDDVENGALQSVPVTTRYDSLWHHFARCIYDAEAPLTSGREARRSLELVLAINHAATSGQTVRLLPN